jgi:S-adenosylmethionine uptake transporter
MACFSAMDAAGSYATNSLGYSIQLTLAVGFGASLLPVVLYISWHKQWRQVWPKNPKLVLLRAAFACTELWLVYQTFTRLTLAESYTLFFTMPLWVALLSWPLLGEKLGRGQALALLLGFAGAVVAVNPQAGGLSTGQLYGLGAALCITAGYLLLRKLSATESTGTLLFAFLGSVFVFNLFTVPAWTTIEPAHAAIMAAGGLVMGIGNVLLITAIRYTPAPLIAPFQYSQIIWGIIYGALLFGTRPEFHTLAGAALIMAAGIWIVRSKAP